MKFEELVLPMTIAEVDALPAAERAVRAKSEQRLIDGFLNLTTVTCMSSLICDVLSKHEAQYFFAGAAACSMIGLVGVSRNKFTRWSEDFKNRSEAAADEAARNLAVYIESQEQDTKGVSD